MITLLLVLLSFAPDSSGTNWPSIIAACLGVLVGGGLALRRIRSMRD